MRKSLLAVPAALALAVNGCGGSAEATEVPEGYGAVVEFLEEQVEATGTVVDYDPEAGTDAELQGLLEEVEEINDGWGGDDWPDVRADASDGVEVAQVASDLEDDSGWLAHVMLDPGESLESDDMDRAREAVEAAEEVLEGI